MTIFVSAFVSLTLTPMMCAKLLHRIEEKDQSTFYRVSERFFQRTIELYGKGVQFVLGHQTATLLVTAGTLVLTFFLAYYVPKGFFPVQDTGVILAISDAPETISFTAMAEIRQQAPRGCDIEGPGRGQFVVIHRRGWHEHDTE